MLPLVCLICIFLFTFYNINRKSLIHDIGEQLVILRDYNRITDDLEDKNDEIKGLREDLEKANQLLSRQQNRLVLYSSPIEQRLQKTLEDGSDNDGEDGNRDVGDDASKQENLPETQVR